MKLEIYFYKDDIEMLMDQGKQAFLLGPGKDWKIIYSGKIKSDYLVVEDREISLPKDKKHIVIIQNNLV